MICVDKINIFSVIKIISLGYKKVYVLGDEFPGVVTLFFLKIIHIQLYKTNFFSGNLKTSIGESVSLSSSKMANKIAIDVAEKELNLRDEIKFLYKIVKKESLILHYAKKILPEIYRISLHIEVVQSIFKEQSCIILKNSCDVDYKNLQSYFPYFDFYTYNNWVYSLTILLKFVGIYIYKGTLKFLFVRDVSENIKVSNRNSILTIQSNTLNLDKSYRNQPYWRNENGKLSEQNIYILSHNIRYSSITSTFFKKNYIYPIEYKFLYKSYNIYKNKFALKRLRISRKKLLKRLSYGNIFCILRILIFIRKCELIGALILYLKIKVFVNEEPYYDYADAIEAISHTFNVKVVGYQYSNLSSFSTPLLSNADYFFTFSNIYKNIFRYKQYGPNLILPNGYPFDFNNSDLIQRAKLLRAKLRKFGANFIICYFDERIDHNKWGTVKNITHYEELALLFNFILDNKSFGLIVKTQFYRYAPSIWYKDNKLINEVIKTGRYFELLGGRMGHRNDVFPAEASHASDICISHKFGGTAALEAALCGSKVVLLNSIPFFSVLDYLYEEVNIERNCMKEVLDSIMTMKDAKPGELNANFGDWSPILDLLNHNRDSLASLRIENKIYELLISN